MDREGTPAQLPAQAAPLGGRSAGRAVLETLGPSAAQEQRRRRRRQSWADCLSPIAPRASIPGSLPAIIVPCGEARAAWAGRGWRRACTRRTRVRQPAQPSLVVRTHGGSRYKDGSGPSPSTCCRHPCVLSLPCCLCRACLHGCEAQRRGQQCCRPCTFVPLATYFNPPPLRDVGPRCSALLQSARC